MLTRGGCNGVSTSMLSCSRISLNLLSSFTQLSFVLKIDSILGTAVDSLYGSGSAKLVFMVLSEFSSFCAVKVRRSDGSDVDLCCFLLPTRNGYWKTALFVMTYSFMRAIVSAHCELLLACICMQCNLLTQSFFSDDFFIIIFFEAMTSLWKAEVVVELLTS